MTALQPEHPEAHSVADLSRAARRLLCCLPSTGQVSAARAGHEAGLSQQTQRLAVRELRLAGCLERWERGWLGLSSRGRVLQTSTQEGP